MNDIDNDTKDDDFGLQSAKPRKQRRTTLKPKYQNTEQPLENKNAKRPSGAPPAAPLVRLPHYVIDKSVFSNETLDLYDLRYCQIPIFSDLLLDAEQRCGRQQDDVRANFVSLDKPRDFGLLDDDGEDHSTAIDRHVYNLSELIMQHERRKREATSDADESSLGGGVGDVFQTTTIITGRVCCDSEARLNSTSIVIEGCRMKSNGRKAQLLLGDVGDYCLFQGQVVGVWGVSDSTGLKFSASSIISGPPLPPPVASREELSNAAKLYKGEQLHMMIASGPFSIVTHTHTHTHTNSDTTCENEPKPSCVLSFEPLRDLLTAAVLERPHTLVLLGPFIHANKIEECGGVFVEKGGNKGLTLTDIYHNTLHPLLKYFYDKSPLTRVLIVTHHSEAGESAENIRVPQAPPTWLAHTHTHLPKNVTLLGNPSLFKQNDLTVGVTSDVAMIPTHMVCTEKGPKRMSKLISAVMHQRCFHCIDLEDPMAVQGGTHTPFTRYTIRTKNINGLYQYETVPHIFISKGITRVDPTVVEGRVWASSRPILDGHSAVHLRVDPPTVMSLTHSGDGEVELAVPLSLEGRTHMSVVEFTHNRSVTNP
eukprot:GHVR01122046.1.p1 GENE.GHVR01122046.1~~GHVR01122046.1.p1  ORF type:complete len:593 (-),score=141.47 GHVR01122046.1:113-1891(-)